MPFENYWHFIALSVAVSIISMVYHTFLIVILFLGWLLYLYLCRKIKPNLVIICIVSILVCLLYLPDSTPSFTGKERQMGEGTFTGKVIGPALTTEKKIEFLFEEEGGEKFLALYFKEENEASEQDIPRVGANCVLSGQLSKPNEASNPHQFDYKDYLWKKGISYQLILPSMKNAKCTGHSSISFLYSFRSLLLTYTEDKFQPKTTAWLNALVFGDDSLLDDQLIEIFQHWGLSHLLAISGLHIGIIVGLLYIILRRFSLVTKEKSQDILLIFLPVYALLAGGQPSVWRASLMVLVVILFSKLKWKISYSDLLSIIFILLIMIDKQIVYHIGFQLSFAVTFGLILSRNWLAQSKSNLETIIQISFVSQMVILPLQLHYFFIFQPLSILLNTIIVPYFSLLVIPFMFFLLIVSFLPKPLLTLFEFVFHAIHDVVISFIELVDTYLDYPFVIGDISLYFMLVYYVIFIGMMIFLEKKDNIKAFQLGCLLSLYIVLMAMRPYLSPYGTVTMLDIGQGDAFVIELPYRKGVFLMDAGATFSYTDFEATDQIYRQIIRPYLQGQGISEVDAIFLSHEHLDHDGSVPFILEDFSVGEIIISDYYKMDEQREEDWQDKLYYASFNEVMTRNNQTFYILSPYIETDSANENSLVVYTEIGGLRWFFSGDIGKETEREIIHHYPDLQLDVLKVGHHGSDTSSDPLLAEKASGGTALISVGENNSHGHPAKEVITTLESAGMEIYRTDKDGAVQFHFKNKSNVFIPYIK